MQRVSLVLHPLADTPNITGSELLWNAGILRGSCKRYVVSVNNKTISLEIDDQHVLILEDAYFLSTALRRLTLISNGTEKRQGRAGRCSFPKPAPLTDHPHAYAITVDDSIAIVFHTMAHQTIVEYGYSGTYMITSTQSSSCASIQPA